MSAAPEVLSTLCVCGQPLGGRPRWCSRGCAERHREYYRRGAGASPEQIAASRARCLAWSVAHRDVQNANHWLRSAPPHPEHLRGVATSLDLGVGRIPLTQASALHGAICKALEWHHGDNHFAAFALFPWHTPSGWALWATQDFRRMHEPQPVRWDGQPATLRWGPLARLKAPRVTRRGRRRVRVDMLTPLSIRCGGESGRVFRVEPTADNLTSALHHLPERLGFKLTREEICVEVLERHTTTDRNGTGFHGARAVGCIGDMLLECNATAHWLLCCAERIGMGGATSLGFGRIRLSEVP